VSLVSTSFVGIDLDSLIYRSIGLGLVQTFDETSLFFVSLSVMVRFKLCLTIVQSCLKLYWFEPN
jgi:hypothetical protein